MSESVIEITEDTFRTEVLQSEKPVLVDFWAEWCMPCRFVAPVVESVAHEFADRIKVGKLNVDDNPTVAAEYSISSIPTLLLFKGGRIVDTVVGAVPKSQIVQVLNRHLAPAVS
ncbi:MAG TPA: thioredoxin [bacterium]|nr:thioredoxin [bacterium]HPN36071.1 thioredoxin [bacterium]